MLSLSLFTINGVSIGSEVGRDLREGWGMRRPAAQAIAKTIAIAKANHTAPATIRIVRMNNPSVRWTKQSASDWGNNTHPVGR